MIYCDKNHIYKDTEGRIYTSVSKIISKYKVPFDKHNISRAVAKRDGVEQDDLLAQWKEKADISLLTGNYIHNLLELCLKDPEKAKNSPIYYEIKKIHDLLPKGEWIQERIIADTEFLIAGTADILIKNDDEITIWDYKTNDLTDKHYNNFKVIGIPQTKKNEYRLQLSIYKYLLERKGYKVPSLKLLNIINGDVEVIELEPLEVENLIKNKDNQNITIEL